MLETKRLRFIPLTYDQLVQYAKADNSLERGLNLHDSNETLSPDLAEALEHAILPAVADPSKNYLYSTLWIAISKAENKITGALCMMGEPNENGEIEIGYGTYEAFRGRGIMTEMVAGIFEWAQTQPRVKSITASTDQTNAASYTVLLKNDFIKTGETETMFQWKREID